MLNRTIAEMCLSRANQHDTTTPVVISGTHILDMCLWLMEGRSPVSVYAHSTDHIFGSAGSKDSTFAIIEMDDGSMLSLNHSWAAPHVWPGAVYGMQVGIIGDRGVIDIEDMHRDLVLASEIPQGAGYKKDNARRFRGMSIFSPVSLWRERGWSVLGARARGNEFVVPAPVYGTGNPSHDHA